MIRITELLGRVVEVLERLGVPYHVGGSFASSVHGLYRTSADVDIVIDPTADQLSALRRELESEFYISESAMNEALAHRSTFNAIHSATSFKFDFFVKGRSPFDAEELRRSVRHVVDEASRLPVNLKSAEDTILRKLEWFRRGGEASERQLEDVRSILSAARGQLDEDHLDYWARELKVSDLLVRLRRETEEI